MHSALSNVFFLSIKHTCQVAGRSFISYLIKKKTLNRTDLSSENGTIGGSNKSHVRVMWTNSHTHLKEKHTCRNRRMTTLHVQHLEHLHIRLFILFNLITVPDSLQNRLILHAPAWECRKVLHSNSPLEGFPIKRRKVTFEFPKCFHWQVFSPERDAVNKGC